MKKLQRTLTEAEHVARLTIELHMLVEFDQGEAYCSDGVYATSMAEFFRFTEAQLFMNRQASLKMAAFLRKHKRLRSMYG